MSSKKSLKVNIKKEFAMEIEDIQAVRQAGKLKYPDDLWKSQTIHNQLEHTIYHIMKYIGGENYDEDRNSHLAHAACRLLFALQKAEDKQGDVNVVAKICHNCSCYRRNSSVCYRDPKHPVCPPPTNGLGHCKDFSYREELEAENV